MTITLPKSVAICANSSTGQPFVSHLDEYEMVLGINDTHVKRKFVPNLIIAMDDLKRDEKPAPDYLNAIVNAGCPVLSTRKYWKWPSVQPYPLKDVIGWFKRYMGETPVCRILDCSISYAMALCIRHNVKTVGLFGIDLTLPYKESDWEADLKRYQKMGYRNPPDWFRYCGENALNRRRPREPGWESIHFLHGFGIARGVHFRMADTTTILNNDRDEYFYGYTKQPRLK